MRELVCPRHMCKVPLGKCMEWDIDEVNRNIAINAGRGSYKAAQEASRLIEETRRQQNFLRKLYRIIYGKSVRHAINIIIAIYIEIET